MSDKIGRIIPGNEASDFFSLATFILTIPDVTVYVDALAVFPGMGEDERLTSAIINWQLSMMEPVKTFHRHLIIAGHNHDEKTTKILTLDALKRPPFDLKRTDGVIIEEEAKNTKEQARQVLTRVKQFNLKSLALFASPFHLPRAYLTLLKTFIKAGLKEVAIIPGQVCKSPGSIIPEFGTTAWEAVAGEAQRIIKYQGKGDVATLNELREYLAWLWHGFLPHAVKK
ncbi:MAG: ElyC/SanA/YdcF family protein [Patescibacteria group bacterium]|nr:ElyC/SanA/YdcF family protein [Patescibacteria group bacterium]